MDPRVRAPITFDQLLHHTRIVNEEEKNLIGALRAGESLQCTHFHARCSCGETSVYLASAVPRPWSAVRCISAMAPRIGRELKKGLTMFELDLHYAWFIIRRRRPWSRSFALPRSGAGNPPMLQEATSTPNSYLALSPPKLVYLASRYFQVHSCYSWQWQTRGWDLLVAFNTLLNVQYRHRVLFERRRAETASRPTSL